MKQSLAPNRVAVYLTVLAGLAGAIAPAVANLDTTSLVGVVAGLATILGAVVKWLEGWQKHEARAASGTAPVTGDAADDAEPDAEHPDAAAIPVANPSVIPKDEGDAGEAGA